MMRLLLALLMAFSWGGAALAADAPPPARTTVPTHADVAYAPAMPATSKGHLLDLYLPAKTDKPAPLVIWTSGSAWMADTGKDGAKIMAPALLDAGFAVAGVSIRSSTQARFPAQVHDIKAAIRFLRANAARYGIDPARIAIMGDSSGGWTSAMAALTGDAPELEGAVGTTGVSSAVQAAVALYPPTNFLEMDRWAPTKCSASTPLPKPGFCHDNPASPESRLVGCAIQTCKDAVLRASPIRYVTPADPPLMILHGRSDGLVPYNQGERLFKVLAHACHTAELYTLPLAPHGPPNGFLEDGALQQGASVERSSAQGCKVDLPRMEAPGWGPVIAFLKRHLK
ncbi:MAG: hypothetical protein RIS85_1753 [Pseudomonadota bacterium]